MSPLTAEILAVLPQTQCTRCGYPDCASYAQAVADGVARINLCPPGGAKGVEKLAAITGQPAIALDPTRGTEGPRGVAIIDEEWCIGCTLCLKVCPTDAILGGRKQMHTVIEAYCTGCELCLPVCPVDCITLENVSGATTGWAAWSQAQADLARLRHAFHHARQARDVKEKDQRLEEKALANLTDLPGQSRHTDPMVLDVKRTVIEAALARARAKRSAEPGT